MQGKGRRVGGVDVYRGKGKGGVKKEKFSGGEREENRTGEDVLEGKGRGAVH